MHTTLPDVNNTYHSVYRDDLFFVLLQVPAPQFSSLVAAKRNQHWWVLLRSKSLIFIYSPVHIKAIVSMPIVI